LPRHRNSINEVLQSVRHYAGLIYEVAEQVRFEVIARMNEKNVHVEEVVGVVDFPVAATDDREASGKPSKVSQRRLPPSVSRQAAIAASVPWEC
jgi:hypothetical protein